MRERWLAVGVGLLLLSTVVMPVAAASNRSNLTYYNNSSAVVDNESWMSGNQDATLENTTNFLTRIGTFVVGSQPGGTDEAAGAIIMSVLLSGTVVGVIGISTVGIVGGAVVAISTIFGLVSAGLAPQWLLVVSLFLLGTAATAIYFRVYR